MAIHNCHQSILFADGLVDHILRSECVGPVNPKAARTILADYSKNLKIGGGVHKFVLNRRVLDEEYLPSTVVDAANCVMRNACLTSGKPAGVLFRALACIGNKELWQQ